MSDHFQTIRIKHWQINLELEDSDALQSNECLKEIVERLLKHHNRDENLSDTTEMSKDIFRFLKLQDRWVAFCSVLLKSRLFHMTKMTTTTSSILPITRLPRNERGKPFLPADHKQIKFNVSHQYPFVGLSFYDAGQDSGMEIGLDLVTFDDYQKQRISVDEFLRYYSESFTPYEWSRICHGPERSRIRNFYIRWAMKESISKAKGIGLAMDFASFQVLIDDFDNIESNDEEQRSLEDLFLKTDNSCQQQTNVISRLQKRGEREEYWILSFKFMIKDGVEEVQGCSCICIGPFSQKPNAMLSMTHEAISIDELVNTHWCSQRDE
jgi:phosphopantetheine--protein transferase-like protein